MAALAEGDQAPRFTLRNQHGQDVAPVGGGEPALVVFYPFAFSSICSSELGDLQQHVDAFASAGVRLVAVSCDPVYALRAMADTQGLTFDLVSDFWPHGDVARAYGCFDDLIGAATRASFLIDRDGAVAWSVTNSVADRRDIAEHVAAIPRLS